MPFNCPPEAVKVDNKVAIRTHWKSPSQPSSMFVFTEYSYYANNTHKAHIHTTFTYILLWWSDIIYSLRSFTSTTNQSTNLSNQNVSAFISLFFVIWEKWKQIEMHVKKKKIVIFRYICFLDGLWIKIFSYIARTNTTNLSTLFALQSTHTYTIYIPTLENISPNLS